MLNPEQGFEALVPLSHLSLDVAEPVVGWEAALDERGIEVVADDIGRPSVSREVLGQLIAEQREHEARHVKPPVTAPVGGGVRAVEGMSAFESMMAAPGYVGVREEFGRPKPDFLHDELAEGQRREAERRAEANLIERARRVLGGEEGRTR